MEFQTLFSGSKGNCALLQTDKNKILVDCGGNASAIEQTLKQSGVCPDDIDAVFVTHEHTDHIYGLSCFCARHKVEIFAHEKCAADVERVLPAGQKVNTFNGKEFEYGDLAVKTYDCEHDSIYCSGFRFTSGGSSVALVTDLGRVTESLYDFIKNCSLLLIESNHDETMLAGGDYPFRLKKRIASAYGHLSNRQAGEVLVRLPELNVGNVWLGHLSLKNNTPEIAFENAVNALKKKQIVEGKDVFVSVVGQYRASGVFCK